MDSTQEGNNESTVESTKTNGWILWSVVWTVLLEGMTCLLRFGAELESTRDTASTIGRITGGLRIHHGYVGLALMLLAWGLSQHYPRCARAVLVAGIALFFSDMIHHFLVLWPITGSPQFDLLYSG